MVLSWRQRRSRLARFLRLDDDLENEDRYGQSLDEYFAKQIPENVDALRFSNRDFDTVGTLATGQFGRVDVVRCRLDGKVYARKTVEKKLASRAREQCSPQFERDLLLRALRSDSVWAPHLLCAFQTSSALELVMQYADGGTLGDVLESSPTGAIDEQQMKWWIPQLVSAIEWCHAQGFAHRDIKPSNLVLTPSAHILLVDFGSAAPLLPPTSSGVQLIPKRYCIVPCGTCDYISPEILACHEDALVAFETDEEVRIKDDQGGYGKETDWWSAGAMFYEMLYGVAPFFANDVRTTYIRIVEHQNHLKFGEPAISKHCKDLVRRLLTDSEVRLGRHGTAEIKNHPFFHGVRWDSLHNAVAPGNLHLPQFTYEAPNPSESAVEASQPFAFSALFESTRSIASPGLSILRATPAKPALREDNALASFIGFSWGPKLDAFDPPDPDSNATPRPLHTSAYRSPILSAPTPRPLHLQAPSSLPVVTNTFVTPMRPSMLQVPHPMTIPRTGTVRRTRAVSEREALQQLVTCVGMSARKKVLESGKKPRTAFTTRFVHDLAKSSGAKLPQVIVLDPSVDSGTSSEGEQPASPSPRPGSAMSRRSATPTAGLGTFTLSTPPAASRTRSRSPTVSMTGPPLDRFDQMEERHSSMMADLRNIEQRLNAVAMQLRSTGS